MTITGESRVALVWQCPNCLCCTKANSQWEAQENLRLYTAKHRPQDKWCSHYNTRPRKPSIATP